MTKNKSRADLALWQWQCKDVASRSKKWESACGLHEKASLEQHRHYCLRCCCCCSHWFVVVIVISILVAHLPGEKIMNPSLLLHFFTIFMKWIIHIFSYNFWKKKDRKARKIASERSYQEFLKQAKFFQNSKILTKLWWQELDVLFWQRLLNNNQYSAGDNFRFFEIFPIKFFSLRLLSTEGVWALS